jgi:hypothetical protein
MEFELKAYGGIILQLEVNKMTLFFLQVLATMPVNFFMCAGVTFTVNPKK